MIETKSKEDELLFPWIEAQITNFLQEKNLEKKDLLNLGIGDTCHVMPECITHALHESVVKMSKVPTGYGSEQGRVALREKITETVYAEQDFSKDEIFITEGIANSLSLLVGLFKEGSVIGVLSPTYPVYQTLLKVMGMKIVEIPAKNDLSFDPPAEKLDGVILCSPNNPTGIAFSKEQLQKWVNWANDTESLILFDGAYESFIFDRKTPRSIYEIEGAKNACLEMRSFSKSIGFSGLRLGYFTVAKELYYRGENINKKCFTMITAKTNGVSYLIQEAGLAALSKEGLKEINRLSANYMDKTRRLKEHLLLQNQQVEGGIHAPYLFWKIKGCSKEKFMEMLYKHDTITIPGIGFGKDGYLRLSGFLTEEGLNRACKTLVF